MKDLLIITVFICVVSIFESTTQSSSPKEMGTIRIQINNLRNDKGTVKVSLFKAKEGFPSETENAFKTVSAAINNKQSTLVLTNIPPGEYAVAFLHDENDNNKMDTNLIGIPKEGYGASNDAKAMLKAPSFDDAKFVLNQNQETLELSITARYF